MDSVNSLSLSQNSTRFIFPFQYIKKSDKNSETVNPYKIDEYDSLYDSVNNALMENDSWKLSEDKGDNYILPYVMEFFNQETPQNGFVKRYRYDLNKIGLGSGKAFYAHKRENGNYLFNISIENVFLYNFRSEIGVLVIDLSLLNVNPKSIEYYFLEGEMIFSQITGAEEVIEFNKSFQNMLNYNGILVKRGNVPLNFRESLTKESFFTEKIISDYGILRIQQFKDIILNIFDKQSLEIIPFYKAHLLGLNYCLIKKNNQKVDYSQIKETFYHLRTFTNAGYLPSKSEMELSNENIYNPFENIYWGVSMFGAAALVFENETTFINKQFKSRVFSEYFKIMLIVLHQNLLLIKYGQILSYFLTNQLQNKKLKHSITEINSIRDRFLGIITRCWFPAVSNNSLHNHFYKMCRQAFNVEQMYLDIHRKLDELDEYLERHHQKLSEQRSKIIEIIAFIFLPLTFITGFWGMNFYEITGSGLLFGSEFPLILNIGFISITFLLYIVLILINKKK